ARSRRNLHTQPFASSGHAADGREQARPSGTFLLDDLVGGLIPGVVTVLRGGWDEAARAAVAEIVITVAQRRSVLLTAPSVSLPALLDVLTARATRMTIERARIHDLGRDARGCLSAFQAMDELPVAVA